jgi:hypothetical protein
MSDTVTTKDLEQLCRIINGTVNGDPDLTPYSRVHPDGEYRANIGAFYVDGAYGGVALYRIVSEGGGVTDESHMGHQPKRELYRFLRGYLEGIQAVQA